jgi:hypothetical protein
MRGHLDPQIKNSKDEEEEDFRALGDRVLISLRRRTCVHIIAVQPRESRGQTRAKIRDPGANMDSALSTRHVRARLALAPGSPFAPHGGCA